ncbi:MAG: thiamine pyrophosphate-dependent dehydrogenase E1 component subunit alpha [Deltaproteobacteria bacterium]|nr:thiamine pyrophosphate-dependent dehydrogenase E1 component subunit alpha [Deltaproteobacteria bacterium]
MAHLLLNTYEVSRSLGCFKIRLFEDRIVDLYARGLVPGLAHLYIGEEAVAAGACAALRDDDYITSTHRGHGHVIAKGAELKLMMAELFGKKTGYCKGKGGSMHIADMKIGILGANGIAGGGLPIAVGAGLSAKWRGTDQVTVSFFGDDASNNGTFHEGLNFASLHKLPVVFVCENNQYGISVHQKQHQPITDIAIRATSYDMPGVVVDGNDVIQVHEAVTKAVRRARAGEGPTLIECKTYRWRGHHEGDPNQGSRYRTKQEIEEWKKKDPVKRLAEKLLADKVVTKKKLEELEANILKEIEGAVAFANESKFPSQEELYEDVYVEG